jgi:hypothetical protein
VAPASSLTPTKAKPMIAVGFRCKLNDERRKIK